MAAAGHGERGRRQAESSERGGGALAALAARQHGVVSYSQLAALGVSKHSIRRRVRSGGLHRLHRGVFAVGHVALNLAGRELAAVLACGNGALLSHRSAARRWGLRPATYRRIEVTATRTKGPQPGILVHTSRVLEPEDRGIVDGIPVTSVARTIVDLAEVLDARWLDQAVHEAEVLRLFDLRAVEAAMARVPGRRGRHRLERVLASYRPEDHEAARGLERRVRELCLACGLPPARSAVVEGAQVDRYWPEAQLVVEADGAAVHHTRRAFHADRSKDRALAALGIQVLRVTQKDLDRPQLLADELRTVYFARRARGS